MPWVGIVTSFLGPGLAGRRLSRELVNEALHHASTEYLLCCAYGISRSSASDLFSALEKVAGDNKGAEVLCSPTAIPTGVYGVVQVEYNSC